MKRQSFVVRSAILLLVMIGLGACNGIITPAVMEIPTLARGEVNSAHLALLADTPLSAIEQALENIYTQVNPSVVSILVTQKQSLTNQGLPGFPNFPFFFGQPQDQRPQVPQEYYSHGAGSGFVWDKDGHIITNNHVVDGADTIEVTFADGATVPATVVGVDPDSDLAVLQVDVPAGQLEPVKMADSTQVKVGQLAVAIGNPFTLQNTMTIGFVSAVGRALPSNPEGQGQTSGPSYTIPDIIQTDAPINPGNSGGVLVNDQGEVIGVTAAIESPVRASAGIGFAIPSAIVQKVVPALIDNGYFDHPWLGLSGMSLSPDLAQAMNLEANQQGALVIEVTPGSPADKAGLHGSDRQVKIEDRDLRVGGDIITTINGQPVKGFDDVVEYLARAGEVGQKVELTVLRDGTEQTLTTTLAARPKAIGASSLETQTSHEAWLGIRGVDLTPEIANAMNLITGQQGVLVEQVELSSPADQAGLRGSFKPVTINGQRLPVGGDVLTSIDKQPITGLADLQAYLQSTKAGQEVTLTILRNGRQLEVPVTLSARSESGS